MTVETAAEDVRLAVLHRFNILDTPQEAEFDDIAQLASFILDAPIAVVSLVDRDRQWFKACVGLSVDHTPRDISFCAHAIAQDDLSHVFVIPDATQDARFKDNPLVTGPPHIRLYAGAPLVTRDGHALGSLCVIDTQPRRPSSRQIDALRVLARSVVAQMELRRSADDLREAQTREVAIIALAKLAETRDRETGAHLERVQSYCEILAEQLVAMGQYTDEIDPVFIRTLHATSPLHDIGKVGIPDGVLLKCGRLTPSEFEIMKSHTTIGASTLDAALERFPGTKFLRMARDIAATHHERFDGTGYPNGLAGEQIPLCGRIVAVANVYDALSNKRTYKEAHSHAFAKGILLKEAGHHFDPVVIAAFEMAEEAIMAVRHRFGNGAAEVYPDGKPRPLLLDHVPANGLPGDLVSASALWQI